MLIQERPPTNHNIRQGAFPVFGAWAVVLRGTGRSPEVGVLLQVELRGSTVPRRTALCGAHFLRGRSRSPENGALRCFCPPAAIGTGTIRQLSAIPKRNPLKSTKRKKQAVTGLLFAFIGSRSRRPSSFSIYRFTRNSIIRKAYLILLRKTIGRMPLLR